MRLRNLLDLNRLQRIQWRSPDEILRIQGLKLQALVRQAYDGVSYYRDLFDAAGVKPEDIRGAGDLARLPVTSRHRFAGLPLEDKTAAGTDLAACRVSSTSGTTGDPLAVYYSAEDETLVNLTWTRGFLARGLKPWHKNAAFVGRPRVKESRSWYEKLGFWRREEISSWDPPAAWVEALRRIRPRVITGYVMTLKILAEELRTNHPDAAARGFRPAAIFHSSAILDEASRRDFEATFGAVVADFYGANEAGCIAWECPECRAYHVNADRVIVEFLKDGRPARPGEYGDIVVTNLHSRVMPFIRYALGDVGGLSTRPVRCGRGLPLMDRIEGRSDDFVILPSGEKISPHPFYHCLDPVPGIRRWRIVQSPAFRLDVALEPGPEYSEETVQAVRANLDRLLKGRLGFNIEAVEALPVSPSEKFRAVRSEIGGAEA